MPKRTKELSAVEVKRLVVPGFHAVGGVPGLHLRVNEGDGRSWFLRAVVNGKRRDIGLGGFPDVSLAAAREAARTTREKIRSGVDPVQERADDRRRLAAERNLGLTFAEAIEIFLTSGRLDALSNAKHRAQWRSTLETYAVPVIGTRLLVDVGAAEVKAILDQIWTTKHETATRVRARLESVFSWAKVAGLHTGDNPAVWKGNLKELMPSIKKDLMKSHHAAVEVNEVTGWFSVLRSREGLAARAMEFLTLTAARSQEIRLATWEEIHFDKHLWIVPAAHMKLKKEHRVPLTPAMIGLLNSLPRMAGTDLIFPGSKSGPMSDMTLAAVMKRMHADELKAGRKGWLDQVKKKPAVPHGIRSTFRDWVAEKTAYPGDLAEVALAHKVGSSVEQAYRRGDMVARRRQMMEDWGRFLGC
ncbi:site-specific integrase [Rhodobacter sp. SY28-1]|uniref:tyrosine-type recombinase/integrase n=1 Tax=Rhodobacter sp. SY28-1 TaxID=2562317 RepID=UPI0010BFF117|nr:site-specific integrase [Rhodobacter sp. SY28-1]